jgi:RNA polymerase sigma-70 factor, ECF subfamily
VIRKEERIGEMSSADCEPTQLLKRTSEGSKEAADQLLPLVYDELRALAASFLSRENRNHSLQPTTLVSEAYLKLIDQRETDWRSKSHFFAIGARIMRRILVDRARHNHRLKRGGKAIRIELHDDVALSPQREEDILAVDEALEKLAQLDERQASMVEMRFFGGLTVEEVAEALGVSKRTVENDWTMVRAWLRKELGGEGEGA